MHCPGQRDLQLKVSMLNEHDKAARRTEGCSLGAQKGSIYKNGPAFWCSQELTSPKRCLHPFKGRPSQWERSICHHTVQPRAQTTC